MEIMSRNVVVTATETTQNADFKIECSGNGSELKRVTVDIYEKNSNEQNYIGNINLEDGNLSCSLKCKEHNYINCISDFSSIVDKLKVEIDKNNGDSSSGGNGGIVDDPTA